MTSRIASTRRALVAVFVANGLGGPSFLARLAERQRELELSDATLGVTLLGLAFGAAVASPAAGWAVQRAGSKRVAVASGVAVAVTLWATGAAPNAPLLFLALAVVGAADAVMDTAMNANGAAYEATTGRSVLHGLHAAWSFGALAGAGIAAVAAALDVSVLVHLAVTGAVIAGLTLSARAGLVPTAPPAPKEEGEPRRRFAFAAIASLAGATIAGALLEGAAGDWSSVQLERLGADRAVAPLGVAAFMAGMVGGRLVGDRRTDRIGAGRVLTRGMALCAVALGVGALWGEPIPFAAGLAVAGYGLSGFFPLAFSAASRVPGVSPGAGAATVSLAARLGFLLSPPLVGLVAEASDLRVAYGGAAAIAVGLALVGRRW